MAFYFKIRMQYKRTHDGTIIETTKCGVERSVLERCLIAKKGPAPSRVLRDGSFTFTSTEFPQDHNYCVRLCEATSIGSNFVRGILIILRGESAHLRTYHKMLSDKISSRRRIYSISCGLGDITNQRCSQLATIHDSLSLQAELTSECGRYEEIEEKLHCLKAGASHTVPRCSKSPASRLSDASKSLASQVDIDEDEYFALVFLSSKHAAAEPKEPLHPLSAPPTDLIIELFEDSLLSRHPTEDGWNGKGSAYFKTTLEYFVHRGIPIQFCLPAFPCKSTNPRKTSGAAPDAAEYEAFSHLHSFCRNLRKIYPPGADFVVVSDGHVFSDCIGMDDSQVYMYTDAVKELSGMLHSKLSLFEGESPIRFVNLRDAFYGPNELLDSAFRTEWAKNDFYRPIKTQIDAKDEHCRRLMLRSCGFDAGMLEKAIKDDEKHSLTTVYRGFSRFMVQDLEYHPDFKHQTASKRGDLANGVAKEMLKRNQAYSHLVESLYPKAIRISIHQHKNHGPKFAINTLPKGRFQAIQTLEDIYSNEDGAKAIKVEEGHIPTPWHIVLIEVEGHAMTYVGKNGIVQDEKKNAQSSFVCEFRDKGRGGRWFLKKKRI